MIHFADLTTQRIWLIVRPKVLTTRFPPFPCTTQNTHTHSHCSSSTCSRLAESSVRSNASADVWLSVTLRVCACTPFCTSFAVLSCSRIVRVNGSGGLTRSHARRLVGPAGRLTGLLTMVSPRCCGSTRPQLRMFRGWVTVGPQSVSVVCFRVVSCLACLACKPCAWTHQSSVCVVYSVARRARGVRLVKHARTCTCVCWRTVSACVRVFRETFFSHA